MNAYSSTSGDRSSAIPSRLPGIVIGLIGAMLLAGGIRPEVLSGSQDYSLIGCAMLASGYFLFRSWSIISLSFLYSAYLIVRNTLAEFRTSDVTPKTDLAT